MKNIYDSINKKLENHSEDGFSYNFEKEQEPHEEALGQQASSRLTSFLYAYSVGKKQLYEPFVAENEQWIRRALKKEADVHDRSFENKAHALLHWLQNDQDDTQLWQNTVNAYNAWFFKAEQPTDYSACNKIEIDLFCEYLQACLFAKDYDHGISVYEHYKGDKLKLTARSGKLALCYAYLRHFAYGDFTLEQLEKTAHNTLPKRLKECYNRGWFEAGVMWLKTVCHARNHHAKNPEQDAHNKTYTAEQTILTLYEYLTDEEKPDFVHELVAERMPT